jgi:hypothetical protein
MRVKNTTTKKNSKQKQKAFFVELAKTSEGQLE